MVNEEENRLGESLKNINLGNSGTQGDRLIIGLDFGTTYSGCVFTIIFFHNPYCVFVKILFSDVFY